MAEAKQERLNIPSLSVEDAVSISRSLFGSKMDLTEEDIRRPQYQRMRKFYTNVLVSHLGIPQEQLTQPHFGSMVTFDYPELHEESSSLFILTMALQRFMYACGVHDFTMNDLLQPKSKRTLHCISAVVNFLKFKNVRAGVLDRAIEEMESVGERHHQLLERNRELRQRIQELRVKRAEEEQHVQKLMPGIEAQKSTINELNREQAAESKKYQQLKTTNAELVSKKADLNVSLAGQREHSESLKSKIVQSPDRFKGETTRLNNAVHSVKINIEEKNIRFQELENQSEGQLQYNEDVQNALKLIKAIGSDIEKQRENITQFDESQDKTLAQKEALKDFTVNIQNLKRQLGNKQEKGSRVARQHEKKVVALTEQTQQSKREEANYVEYNFEELMVNSKDVENKIQEIICMVEEKDVQNEKVMATLRNAYSQLLEQLDKYHGSLNRAWAKVLQAAAV